MVLDSSNVVVGYRYSCNTRNAEGNPVKEEYDIAVLIGRKIVAQQGLCEQTLDEDNNDEYVRILTEPGMPFPARKRSVSILREPKNSLAAPE